jgi:hypothetical protein
MSTEQPGYSERDTSPTTEQTGGDPEELEQQESADAGAQAPDEGQEGDES